MPSLQQPPMQSEQRPPPPAAVLLRPKPSKPSDDRTREQRAVRNHERLVTEWLRSLSTR